MRNSGDMWLGAGVSGESRRDQIGSALIDQAEGGFVVELDITAVQRWIDSPATNLGVLLLADVDGAWLASSENDVAELRPQLRVDVISE
jgi:hypothetical protein